MNASPFKRYGLTNQKLALLGCLAVGLCIGEVAAQEPSADVSPAGIVGELYQTKEGPWGKLTYYYVYLEAPLEYLAEFEVPNSISKWTFHNHSLETLKSLLVRAKLGPALIEYLLDPENSVDRDGIITLFPPLPDLEAMTPTQRSVIYQELAKFSENEFHQDPVYFVSGSAEDWLKGCSLPTVVQEKIRKMTYMRGEVLAFSDFSLLLNYVTGEEEIQLLLKALTRTRTLVARLDVSAVKDVESLSAYWSGRRKFKSILPFLKSVTETKSVDTFDVVHLLPSLARRYLYTYAPLDYGTYGRMPDCHWTSLNFFNHLPKQYFLDSRLSSEMIGTGYEQVSGDWEFGDVLMFIPDLESRHVIHSCVYVADNIVYTKNGESTLSPWILCTLDEVKKIYFPFSEGRVAAYRRKNNG